jgi:iron complex outermembrane receptor protein
MRISFRISSRSFNATTASILFVLFVLTAGISFAADEPAKGEKETVQDNKSKDANKDKDKIKLEEVVVTAPAMREPLVVETDPRAPRQPYPAKDGADILKNIPGFSVIRKGGTDGDPVLRGMAGSRLNILLDGQSFLGGCGQRMDPPTAYVFPDAYDRIKVVKGPETVLYGGGNLGGTVSFERDIKRFKTPDVQGHFGAAYGSFNRNDQFMDLTGGVPIGFVNIKGSRNESDDYRDGDGRTVHSKYNRWSLGSEIGLTPWDNTAAVFSVDKSDGKAAYADRAMDGARFDREGYGLKLVQSIDSFVVSKITARAYHNYIDHVMDNYTLRDKPARMMYMMNNPDRETTGGSISTDLVFSNAVTAVAGVDYQKNEHTLRTGSSMRGPIDVDSLSRTPDMTFENVGVFGEVTVEATQKDRIIGGLRGDFLSVDNEKTTGSGAGSGTENDTMGGFLRYEHDLTALPLTFFAGFGHAERPADWWERNRNFHLSPEKSNQADVGLIYSSEALKASLSAFYAEIGDYILIKNDGVTARGIEASTVGGEADVTYMFIKNWKAGAALSYVYGEDKTDNAPLAQMPPLEGRLSLGYDNNIFSATALARIAAAQNRYYAGWGNIVGQDIGRSDGFEVFSFNVGYKPVKGLLLAAGVDNIFDKTYAEAISRSGAAVAGFDQTTRVNEPGRSFWVKANYNF